MTSSSSTELAVLGLWHLGSVSTAAWLRNGHAVAAWDPDPELRAGLAAGQAPVAEAGVEEELAAGLASGRLRVAQEAAEAIESAAVTHLAFDTQLDEFGRVHDPRLAASAAAFAEAAPDGALLLVSSQVPVGTCAGWRERAQARGRSLLLAHVPENLRLGTSLDDFVRPARLLIGADDDAAFERTRALFASSGVAPIRLGLASAEMAKHATNAYLGLCIAFANDLAWLSLHAGADPAEVSEALRADPRVSPTAPLRHGVAFSGATLSRDLAALRAVGEEAGRADLFTAVVASNERHAGLAVQWLEETLDQLAGATVAAVGLTYKPGTSTLRDSLPLRVIGRLLERDVVVQAWDPSAEGFDPPPGLTRAASLVECVAGADAVVVLTALPELRSTDWNGLRPARRLVVDTTMTVDRGAAEAAGWTYRGLAAR